MAIEMLPDFQPDQKLPMLRIVLEIRAIVSVMKTEAEEGTRKELLSSERNHLAKCVLEILKMLNVE